MGNPTTFRAFTDSKQPKMFRQVLRTEGAAILEFAISLPLLVVFVVGIYDFGGAYNQKQKIEQAAQEGAIIAAAQPTSDLAPYSGTATNPISLQPVVAAIFNSLAGSNVINPGGSCTLSAFPVPTQKGNAPLTWTYKISSCSSTYPDDTLIITVNRAWVVSTSQKGLDVLGSKVTVSFPYNWRFNSAIQVLIPGAKYSAVTNLQESASVHNQA